MTSQPYHIIIIDIIIITISGPELNLLLLYNFVAADISAMEGFLVMIAMMLLMMMMSRKIMSILIVLRMIMTIMSRD